MPDNPGSSIRYFKNSQGEIYRVFGITTVPEHHPEATKEDWAQQQAELERNLIAAKERDARASVIEGTERLISSSTRKERSG